jgi:hypothetical protein
LPFIFLSRSENAPADTAGGDTDAPLAALESEI